MNEIKEKVLKDNICKLHPITSERAIDITIKEVKKVIDEHIVSDDYMGIDTKQSLKELKEKLEKEE